MKRAPETPTPTTLQHAIEELLTARGTRLLAPGDVARALERGLPQPPSREEVEETLAAMEQSGRIVRMRGKKYSLIEFTPYFSGRLRVHHEGYGFLLSRDPEVQDLRIPKRGLRGAMDGDFVLVRIEKSPGARPERGSRASRPNGTVIEILERRHSRVVGRFVKGPRRSVLVPFDERLTDEILVPAGEEGGAEDGQMVTLELSSYPGENTPGIGSVVEILGRLGEPGVDIAIVVRKHGLRHEFEDDVLAESERLPLEVSERDAAGREDFRGHAVVTIDGETAKDFDDAVSVARAADGNYILAVHIADVSHYVREGSAVDAEGRERGTSVYFPGFVIPMLPERLSNEICSLKPQVDRLTFSAIMEFDKTGNLIAKRFSKSIIHSRERMTYTEVRRILEDDLPADRERFAHLWDEFHLMAELAKILEGKRRRRGSLDFDLPEADVMLSERGEITGIYPSERNVAHKIIEEFMLAANEAVATELFWAPMPALYRVHDRPDPARIMDLQTLLAELGHVLKGNPEEIHAAQMQKLLAEIAGTPEERFLSELVLRSMKRALYSQECRGHFALAAKYYLHFTSPIRRYPDLVVHRRLAELLAKGAPPPGDAERLTRELAVVAISSSEAERRATEAEREVLEWKKVIFMRDKIGNEYAGFVAGVVPFGLFVELEDFFVEGLVPVQRLGTDFFHYDEKGHRMRGERSSREFRLGDPVRVRVEGVDENRRQVNFSLAGVPERPERADRRGAVPAAAAPRGTRPPRRPARRK